MIHRHPRRRRTTIGLSLGAFSATSVLVRGRRGDQGEDMRGQLPSVSALVPMPVVAPVPAEVACR
jgi:hypothetical protein